MEEDELAMKVAKEGRVPIATKMLEEVVRLPRKVMENGIATSMMEEDRVATK